MSKNKKHYSPKPNFPNKTTSFASTSNKKKNTRKKLSFWLVVSFLIICGVGSILGSYSFVENRVKADVSSVSFFGSNVAVGSIFYHTQTDSSGNIYSGNITLSEGDAYNYLNFTNISIIITPSSNNNVYKLLLQNNIYVPYQFGNMGTYYFKPTLFSASSTYLNSIPLSSFASLNTLIDSNGNLDLSQFFNLNRAYTTYFYFTNLSPLFNNIRSYSTNVICISSSGVITSDIIGVGFSFSVEPDLNNYYYNTITYYCSNNNTLKISFSLGSRDIFNKPSSNTSAISNPSSIYQFSNRYYSFSANGSSDYQQGYNAGLNANQENIFNDGFNSGEQVGYNNGYDVGYIEGRADAGNYTFFSLMAAVVDAPVTAVTGLLNFQIFGIEMSSLFFGFLTIALVIFVVRKLT